MEGSIFDIWRVVEFIAVLSGLGGVVLSIRRNVATYPVALLSVVLYTVLCYRGGIYADMGLNVFYAVISIYGWMCWKKSLGDESAIHVRDLSISQNAGLVLLSCLLWITGYLALVTWTDSTVPTLDAFTTAFSLTGTFLMAGRRIEHWWYWMAVNSASVPLYAYKGLYLTAVQFLIFFLLSIRGRGMWLKAPRDRV